LTFAIFHDVSLPSLKFHDISSFSRFSRQVVTLRVDGPLLIVVHIGSTARKHGCTKWHSCWTPVLTAREHGSVGRSLSIGIEKLQHKIPMERNITPQYMVILYAGLAMFSVSKGVVPCWPSTYGSTALC